MGKRGEISDLDKGEQPPDPRGGVSDLDRGEQPPDSDTLGALDPEPAVFDPAVGPQGIDKEARDREMHEALFGEPIVDGPTPASERAQAEARHDERVREQIESWRAAERAFTPAEPPDDYAPSRDMAPSHDIFDEAARMTDAFSDITPVAEGKGFRGFARGGIGAFVETPRQKKTVVPEAPGDSEQGPDVRIDVGSLPERQAHPAHGSAERQAHAPHGSGRRTVIPEGTKAADEEWPEARAELGDVPERQAHPAHGRQAHPAHGGTLRQAHPAHGSKKPLLIAGIGMLIAVVTVSVAVAAPRPAPAPAAPAAATLTPQPAGATTPVATAPAAAATRAVATAAPVGATIVITPYHSWAGSGSCAGRQTLEPKTVANPPVGESVAYEWDVTWPSCSSGRSWGIDYPREPFMAANTLFRPRTTYSISPLERGACSAGMCRQPMVVIVKNEAG